MRGCGWFSPIPEVLMSWQSHTLFSGLYSVGYEAVAVALFLLEEELKNCKTFLRIVSFQKYPDMALGAFGL